MRTLVCGMQRQGIIGAEIFRTLLAFNYIHTFLYQSTTPLIIYKQKANEFKVSRAVVNEIKHTLCISDTTPDLYEIFVLFLSLNSWNLDHV